MLHVEWYHICWPRLTAKRVEPVVSISWASCLPMLVCMLKLWNMRGRRGGGQSLFTKGAWLKVFSNPHYVYCLLFYHCSACCSTQSRTKSTDCDKTTLNTGDCLTGQWSCLYITDHARRANDTAYPQHSRDHMTSASRVRHGSLLVTTENVHSLPQAAAVLTADSECRPTHCLTLSTWPAELYSVHQ